MMRRAWRALIACAFAAIVLLIFHAWRQGALDLLPVNMTFC